MHPNRLPSFAPISVGFYGKRRIFLQTGSLTAGAGCRLEKVNQFLLARGRFLPAGSCRTVGLVGLTLGGGDGMFARKWGLTCDHLIRIKVVDGTGGMHDSKEEPDLLWSSRGGGNGPFRDTNRTDVQHARRAFTIFVV